MQQLLKETAEVVAELQRIDGTQLDVIIINSGALKKKQAHVPEFERVTTSHDLSPSRSDDAGPPDNAPATEAAEVIPDHRPKCLLRTCLSSLASSSDFGLQMSRESQRRLLHKATAKAFIGDGLSWNWTIGKKHFQPFEPILDFMHAVEYVYAAAVFSSILLKVAGWNLLRAASVRSLIAKLTKGGQAGQPAQCFATSSGRLVTFSTLLVA